MKKISLFVGFTPYHSFFAKNIIDDCDGEVWCLFTKGWPKTKKRGYRKLGFFIVSNKWKYNVSYVLSMIYFSIKVRMLLRSRNKIDVYVPHPDNIFSNFLFFSKKINNLNIYEDGILNYYDADVSCKSRRATLSLLGRLLGIPYYSYSGHLAGYDAKKVDKLYVSNPENVVQKRKIGQLVEVNIDVTPLACLKERILFLDQNTAPVLEDVKRRELLNSMMAVYSADTWKYFYKGHHEFSRPISGMESIKKNLSGLPAEEVVVHVKPQVVVSFYSSALINIKKLYPNVECVHLAGDSLLVNIDNCESRVSEILEACGVRPLILKGCDNE
jgi:hypothetical protein